MRGNNGEKSVKDIIGLIVTGETAEMLIYFPELTELIQKVDSTIKDMFNRLATLYSKLNKEDNQKEFAQQVFKEDGTKSVKNLFFSARKNNTTPRIEFNKLLAEQQIMLIDKYITENKIQIKM